MSQSRLCVLGKFSLELEQVTAPSLATQKARALLAYLVTHRSADVGRERLLEVLWPEIEPERAREGLRSALWSIRRAIRDAGFEPDDYVSANRSVIRWHAQTECDADAFMAFAHSDEPRQLENAFETYKGDYIEGDYEEWTVAERARFSTAYESVLSRLVRVAHNLNAAQLLLGLNPYDEPSYLLLIEAELSAGRVVAAEALAERCERALAEVGAQPSAALRNLVSGIASRQVQSVPTLVLPFVGREVELAEIRDRLTDQSAGNALLMISGEAGIGKSAFLSHATGMARALGRTVVSVRCFESDARPYGPFEELHSDLSDEPLDLMTANENIDPALRLADSIAASVEAGSVIVIDDAHSLAAQGLRVLAQLASQLSQLGCVPIVATRTEGISSISLSLRGTTFRNIALTPLRQHELRAAIDAVVVDDAEQVAVTLFKRSGGHPLFAKTLLDSLAQSGLLRPDRGMWRLVGSLDQHATLPVSLTSYIHARLRARGDTAASVAAALALEPSATADDLIAVLQLPEARVLDALDDLLALGIVTQPASGPQLTFAHDLYRDVAGASMNAGRRARLHRAFAERFASSAFAESSLRCARHWTLAGDTLRAGEAFERAAVDALNQRAWMEARDRCIAGIAGLERLERQPQVETLLARLKMISAQAQTALGDAQSAVTAASDAIALAKRSGAALAVIEAALARQRAFLDDFEIEAALLSSQEIVAMAREAKEQAALSIALADQSSLQRLLGLQAEAVQAATEAETIAIAVGDWDIACYALEQLILADATWWRFAEAVDAAARTRQILVRASRPAQTAMHCALAAFYLAHNKRDEAFSQINTANMLLREDEGEPRRSAHSPVAAWLATSFGPARLKLMASAIGARCNLEGDAPEFALTAAQELENLKTPRSLQLSCVFRSEAEFELGLSATVRRDAPMLQPSRTSRFIQDVCSGIRSPERTEMFDGDFNQTPDVQERLLLALDSTESISRRMPLDADHAFGVLARIAERCKADHIALRARLRRNDYRAMRIGASSPAMVPTRAESSIR